MGNFLRVLMYAAFATGIALLFTADVCQITDSVAHKQEVIRLANTTQETSLLQAKHVASMEDAITRYRQEMGHKDRQLQLLEKALETATLQVQGLVNDNSKLEAELDVTATELKATINELLRTKETLADKLKELEELKSNG